MENEINRYRTKEDMRMVNKCIKNAQHYMSQENHKVKQKIRYHDTSHREAEIQNIKNIKCWWGCGETGTLTHCWWDCKMVQTLWKTVWPFVQKQAYAYHIIQRTCFLVITQMSWKFMSTQNLHTYLHSNCIHNCLTWKESRGSSIDKWINNMCDIYAIK